MDQKTNPAIFQYLQLHCNVRQAFDEIEIGIPRVSQLLLVALAQQNGQTMSELSKKVHIASEQTTRAFAFLVDKGYAVRKMNEKNHRVINGYLTEAGYDAFQKFSEKFSAL